MSVFCLYGETLGGVLSGSWMEAGHQEKLRRVVEKTLSLQKYIHHQRQNVGRDVNDKGGSVEISCRNDKHINRD